MEILQIQIAFFFTNIFEGTFEELALNIKKLAGNTDTQYIPIPSDAPPEIPRLILNYKDKNINLNFSKNRTDIFVKNLDTTTLNFIGVILGILIDDSKCKINRIGFVQKSFLETDINKLLDILIEARRPANAKEISIKVNIPKEIHGYTCNCSESISFVKAQKNENGNLVTTNGLLIEKDINTEAEKAADYTFTKEASLAFLPDLNNEAQVLTLITV